MIGLFSDGGQRRVIVSDLRFWVQECGELHHVVTRRDCFDCQSDTANASRIELHLESALSRVVRVITSGADNGSWAFRCLAGLVDFMAALAIAAL
jgi:hypothetical protein